MVAVTFFESALWTALILVAAHVLPSLLASKILVAPSGRIVASEYVESAFAEASSGTITIDDAAWRRVRLEGWISNTMVIAVVVAMFARHNSLRQLVVPFEGKLLWTMLLCYALDSIRSLLSILLAFTLNRYAYKMSTSDFWLIRRRRDEWTEGVETSMLIDRYGLLPTKIMDAVNRRVGHVVHYGIHFGIFMVGCKSRGCLLQLYVIFPLFRCLVHVVTENSDLWGIVDYSGARIRDGRYGRFNLVVVSFWGGFGKLFMIMCLVLSGLGDEDYNTFRLYALLCMQGVMWGDTAGEVVGSFFGRLEFQVRGFGETNKKTVEGTLAVWFATALSSWCVTMLPQFQNVQFQAGKYVLICAMSTVATIMEVASPRGTDNFFLLAGGISTVLFFS